MTTKTTLTFDLNTDLAVLCLSCSFIIKP
jgi:hypothetical protein